jgi:hypothetical protein
MVHSVSPTPVVSQAVVHQEAAQPKPQQAASATQKDTVQLSPEAKAGVSGDKASGDHNGDRH